MTDTPRCLAIRRCKVKCHAQAAARPHWSDILWHRRCRPIDLSLKRRSFPTGYAIFVDIKARCVVFRSYVKSGHVGAEKEVKHAAPSGQRAPQLALVPFCSLRRCRSRPLRACTKFKYGCGKGVRGVAELRRIILVLPTGFESVFQPCEGRNMALVVMPAIAL